jgi:hypothetical protein
MSKQVCKWVAVAMVGLLGQVAHAQYSSGYYGSGSYGGGYYGGSYSGGSYSGGGYSSGGSGTSSGSSPIIDPLVPSINVNAVGRTATWTASTNFVAALNTMEVKPGVPSYDPAQNSLTVPVGTLTVSTSPSGLKRLTGLTMAFTTTGGEGYQANGLPSVVSLKGTVLLTANNDDLLTGGGSIQFDNMRVDAARGVLVADVTGGNDLGTVNNVDMFSLKNMAVTVPGSSGDSGSTSFSIASMTSQGFDVWHSALSLTPDLGDPLWQRFTSNASLWSFGTLTVGVAMVPENSTWAMMALGLAGVGVAGARRRSLLA